MIGQPFNRLNETRKVQTVKVENLPDRLVDAAVEKVEFPDTLPSVEFNVLQDG